VIIAKLSLALSFTSIAAGAIPASAQESSTNVASNAADDEEKLALVPADMNGTSWQVKSVQIEADKGRDFRVSRKHKASVSFANGVFSGHDGCNSFFGLYVQNEERLLTFPRMQTLLGCSGKWGADADAVSTATSEKLNLTVKSDSKLNVFRRPGASSVWSKIDCADCEDTKLPKMDDLTRGEWDIRSVSLWDQNGFARPYASAKFTDKGVTISSDCGVKTASYSYDLATMRLSFTEFAETGTKNKSCKAESIPAAAEMFKILSDNPAFSLAGGSGELLVGAYDGIIWMERKREK